MLTITIKDNLKSLRAKYVDLYKAYSNSSRNAYIKEMAPGEKLPPEGKIYGQIPRYNFDMEAGQIAAQAESEIKKLTDYMKEERAKAPSTDAINALSALKMRKNISAEDLNAFAEVYGDNYTVFKNLGEIAAENHIPFNYTNTIDTVGENIEQISSVFTSMNANFAERNASPGYNSFAEMYIDSLPDSI